MAPFTTPASYRQQHCLVELLEGRSIGENTSDDAGYGSIENGFAFYVMY